MDIKRLDGETEKEFAKRYIEKLKGVKRQSSFDKYMSRTKMAYIMRWDDKRFTSLQKLISLFIKKDNLEKLIVSYSDIDKTTIDLKVIVQALQEIEDLRCQIAALRKELNL
jgi:hypothetical protein